MAHPTPIRGLGPASRLDDAARRILAGRLADVRRPEEELAEEISMEGVHDMRVATRRLRAALQVFQGTGRLKKAERQVKRLQDALGEVRDVHVQLDWMDQAARREKPRQRGALKALRARREALLGRKEVRLRAELKRWRKKTVPSLLRRMERLEDGQPFGGKHVRGHLLWRLRRVERRMARYAQALDALSAHALRKELKKLRYELELLQPALHRPLGALLKVLVSLQDRLGELHDADVRLELLEREAARKLLLSVQAERAQRSEAVARVLQRWRSEQLARKLRRLLG